MLRVTIPDHRLPKDRLQDDLDYLASCGLNIKTNMTLGKDFSLDDLFKQGYKAVFLATGAHKPLEMGVPGEEAEGVLQALEYLKDHHLGIPVDLGKRVVVIGGGNSAVDAARVAFRDKRVKQATILYRRTRKEMPAYPEEIEAGLEEGVAIEYLTAPVRVRTQDGRVVGVECIRMKLGEKDASGRARPVPVPGSEFQVPADTLILAISERAYTPYLKDSDGLTLSPEWGTIIVDPASMATTRPGVFAGGDVVSGPSSVVEAMAAGKTRRTVHRPSYSRTAKPSPRPTGRLVPRATCDGGSGSPEAASAGTGGQDAAHRRPADSCRARSRTDLTKKLALRRPAVPAVRTRRRRRQTAVGPVQRVKKGQTVKNVTLTMDGTQQVVRRGTTVLEAARAAGIPIPTLCHHDKLKPAGAAACATSRSASPPSRSW